jgi:peptidoglycan/LPS O-acetylase OafA/YrhL
MMAHMLRPTPGEQVSLFGYLKKRFFRLILPYWLAVMLFAAGRWCLRLFFGRGDDMPSILDVLAQLLLVQEFLISPERNEKVVPVGYWSMVTIEQFYLVWLSLYGVCMFCFGRSHGYGRAEKAMMLLTFLVCIGSITINLLDLKLIYETSAHGAYFAFHPGFQSQGQQIFLPTYGAYLAMGMLLFWSIREKRGRGLFEIALLYLAFAGVYTGFSRLIKGFLVSLLFIPLARGYHVPDCKVYRWLSFCGQRSYSIYLMHSIAGMFFIMLVWRMAESRDWLAIPLTCGAFAISILAAAIYYRFVEIPCQTRSRRVVYRRKHPAMPFDQAAKGKIRV